jgi:hypothetical protein
MSPSSTTGVNVRRQFTENPEDYAGMCHRHRERSGFLHQMISEGNVLNWAETDSACPDGGEPPITVFVVVLLNTVDEFVDLVRKAKGGVAEGRIESMMMTQPGVLIESKLSLASH